MTFYILFRAGSNFLLELIFAYFVLFVIFCPFNCLFATGNASKKCKKKKYIRRVLQLLQPLIVYLYFGSPFTICIVIVLLFSSFALLLFYLFFFSCFNYFLPVLQNIKETLRYSLQFLVRLFVAIFLNDFAQKVKRERTDAK